jgi:hypothetical protein
VTQGVEEEPTMGFAWDDEFDGETPPGVEKGPSLLRRFWASTRRLVGWKTAEEKEAEWLDALGRNPVRAITERISTTFRKDRAAAEGLLIEALQLAAPASAPASPFSVAAPWAGVPVQGATVPGQRYRDLMAVLKGPPVPAVRSNGHRPVRADDLRRRIY